MQSITKKRLLDDYPDDTIQIKFPNLNDRDSWIMT